MQYFVSKFHFDTDENPRDASLIQSARDILCAMLAECGYESFEETTNGVDAFVQTNFYDKQRVNEVIESFPLPMVRITYLTENVPDQNWNATWEDAGFEPIFIGDDVVIFDAKHNDASDFQQTKKIGIETAQAFGTGTHQTTQMIVNEIREMQIEGKKVLDCGCGTGILSIVTMKFGAASAFAYDIDEWSVRNTQHNAERNHVEGIKVALGDASILQEIHEQFDVVFANINRNILLHDMPTFADKLSPTGTLILSGFYEEDIPLLLERANAFHLFENKRISKDHWACLVLKKA